MDLKFGALLLFTLCFTATLPSLDGANILFYFGVSSYSHRIAVWPLVTALAESGSHKVTFVTIYPPKPEHLHLNVTEFSPSLPEEDAAIPEFEDILNTRLREGRWGTIKLAARLPEIGLKVCSDVLSTPATKQWIQDSAFDLVIIDALFNECGFGLAHKFGAKTLIYSTTTVFSWWHDAYGFPAETSWISDMIIPFQIPLSFTERVLETLIPLIQYYQFKYWSYFPRVDKLLREKLNLPEMPSVLDLEKETQLILLSTHYSEEFSRSLPPLFVPIGGLHLEKSAKGKPDAKKKIMSPELKKWMDESGSDGFIYISFGSIVQISQAPEYLQNIFYTAIKNTKTRFIWKFETERPKNMPDNVLTGTWMPQQDILAHPKIKAFITHSGLLGLTEALTNGVPVLMFPVFAEQDYNAFRFEREGRGIRLEVSTLTLPEFENALNEILTNPKYKEAMLRTKKLFYDRPMTPLQTAVWWTEYVLRHDNLTCLKPLSMSQTWYERRLLDVWAFIGGIALLLLLTIFYLAKILLVSLFCSSNSRTSGTKLKKS